MRPVSPGKRGSGDPVDSADAVGIADPADAVDAAFDPDLGRVGLCLGGVLSRLGAYGGGVYLLDEPGTSLLLTAFSGLPPQFAGPWRSLPVDAPTAVTDAIREHDLVWIDGAEEMARRYPLAALTLPYHFASASVPLLDGPEVLGAMFVNWSGFHPPHLTRAERARLWAAADALGRLLADAAAAGRPVRPGPEALSWPGAPPGGDTAAARLPEGLCALAVDGSIALVTPAAARLLETPADTLLGARLWDVIPWLDRPIYQERYRAAAMSQETGTFEAMRPPATRLVFDLYPDASGITVRITETAPPPDPASGTAPPTTVPEPAEDPQSRLEGIYHELHLAAALTSATSVHDVVRLVAHELLPMIGASRVALFAVDEAGRLEIVGTHGHPPGTLRLLDGIRIDQGHPGAKAIMSGLPLFAGTREEMDRLYPDYRHLSQGEAWAILPMAVPSQRIGACLLSFDRPHRFTAEERASLLALGALISQALFRARHHDATHGIARDLQRALLPHSLPRLRGLEVAARYRPAAAHLSVGGDFYDLIRLDRHRAAAVIGDIQGHDATAAALMGQVRTAIRAHATAGADPRRVLARTNRLLTDLDTDLLASAAYLHVALDKRRVLVSRAGHPAPLLRHRDGTVEALDVPGGILLGVDAAADYPRAALTVPPGAIICLYTDGLTDRPGVDPDRSLAGLADRLSRAGTADPPLDELAETLIADASGTDDTTLLLLRLGQGRRRNR
ncbi:SpoIIE family protein phosphatase [Yinghuangia aomiensis]|uniref:SpoIIE family protein phosphatase n=1 Tax=Yinghuangia aomiensis TaxID=676205 RepID=A0ABP9HDV8_9ACTN